MTRASRNASAPHHQRPPAPVTVGYVRTVIGQSPVPQINTLIQAGVAEAGIYLERARGHKTSWPVRDLLLARLHRGDTVKITRLDRFFYSIQNLVVLGTDLRERGVRLHVIEQDIDSESLQGRDLFGMLSALADLHREFVTTTTNDGLAAARARGNVGGRPAALTAGQIEQAVQLYDSGTPVAHIARQFNVSRATIYRYISLLSAIPGKHVALLSTNMARPKPGTRERQFRERPEPALPPGSCRTSAGAKATTLA